MKFAKALHQQFINLCEIPAMYRDLADSLTIDIEPRKIYDKINAVRAIVHCDRVPTAREIVANDEILMDIMQILKLSSIRITCRGDNFVELMNPVFSTQTKDISEIMNNIDIGIDLNSLYASSNQVYLIDMNTDVLLFANPVACSYNQKSANEFLGANFAALTYPDEIEKRKRLLRLDGKLTEYEFKAMAYYQDGDFWRRREVRVIGDYQKIDFFGCECRLGVDSLVEETRRFVD